MVNLPALNCRTSALSRFCHASAMQFSHELSHCTIDFCSAAFILAAV
jgi:hypothetical protein